MMEVLVLSLVLVLATQTRQSSSTLPTIPNWCYSPDGKECNWYRECLEKRHPCECTKHAYALTYAYYFCNLYKKTSSGFSASGLKWIDGVRKCLQVKLVPILMKDAITCKKIKDEAFDSHDECYTNPGYGAPSICELGMGDWWKVFWTIKGSILSMPFLSQSGIIKVALKCGVFFFE